MSTLLSTALRLAAAMQGRRVRNVVLPMPELRAGAGRRAAVDAPLNARPISILRPERDTAASVHDFVLEQFPASARRLAR